MSTKQSGFERSPHRRRRSWTYRISTVAVWWLCCVTAMLQCWENGTPQAQAQEPQLTSEMGALGSLRDIRDFQTREGYPEVAVQFQAQLVFAGPKRSWFSVQDGTAASRVTCRWETSELVSKLPLGTLLRIRGKTVKGRFDIALQSYDVVDQESSLEAKPIWESSLDFPLAHYAYAEMEGYVREVLVGPHGGGFFVQSGLLLFRVDVDRTRNAAPSVALLGAKAKFRGAVSPATNDQHANYFLHCMDYTQIELSSPTATLVRTERNVTVLYSNHLNQLIVDDDEEATVFRTSFAQYVNPGDQITVLVDGDKKITENMLIARGIVFNATGTLPNGVPANASELLSANELPARVSLTGVVLDSQIINGDMNYSLRSDKVNYQVRIPKWQLTSKEKILLGDTLSVTGCPIVEGRATPNSSEPNLILFVATKEDVSIISTRAILTGPQLLWGFMSIGAVIAAIGLWNYSLSCQVAARSKQLLELNAQLRDSYNADEEAVLFSSQAGNVVNVNTQFSRVFGFGVHKNSKIYQVHDNIARLCTPAASFDSLVQEANEGRRLYSDIRIATNGMHKVVSVTHYPVLGDRSAPIGNLWIFSDVTAKRELEAKLAHAKKMEVVGQLSGSLAHDFNNLLAVVKANLSLCTRASKSGMPIDSFTRLAERALDSAAGLTQHLLDFAKRSQLSMQAANVYEILERVHSMLGSTIDSNIQFHLDFQAPVDSLIRVDVVRFEQVIVNLCLNARDAIGSESGEICIRCCRAACEDAKDTITVEVQDDGCGIDPAIASRVFEPFFTTKPIGRGTGLGLSMVVGLVEQMGGTVQFTSTPGLGTTFTITIPLIQREPVREAGSTHLERTREEIRVLVVDDEELVEQSIVGLLTFAGHRCETASNGAEALESLSRDSDYDVVILDMVMPVLCGVEAGKIIRSRWPHIKILFLSGNRVPSADQLELKGVEYLAKPFEPVELESTVERLASH